MIDNRTVLWYNIGIKRWFSVQYRFGMAHQNQESTAHAVLFDFEGSFRYENPASCKQGSHFYSLGAACPERSEDFDLPYGSPLPAYVEHLGICRFSLQKSRRAVQKLSCVPFLFLYTYTCLQQTLSQKHLRITYRLRAFLRRIFTISFPASSPSAYTPWA